MRSHQGLLAALVVAGAGCAMSEAQLAELETGVSRRNDARYQKAVEELQRKGYVFIDDEAWRSAVLDQPGREACLAAERSPPTPLPEAIQFELRAPTRPGKATPPAETVSASASAACTFFRGRAQTLDVTRSDRTGGRLKVSAQRILAKTSAGEIVIVVGRPLLAGKHSVLVERTCNYMPSPEPDLLDRQSPIGVLWDEGTPPRTVDMSFQREEVDVECTKKTY